MIKYLVKRDHSFWFRRKIKGYGEIIFSLQTKSYDSTLVRHSSTNYKINTLINHKRFHKMNALEVALERYKNIHASNDINAAKRKLI